MTTWTTTTANIVPPHRVTSRAKMLRLAARMRRDGWQGRPLLLTGDPDAGEVRSWTGSHRIAAVQYLRRERGLIVEVPYVTMAVEADDPGDDYERLALLIEAGDEAGAAILREELAAN